MGARASRRRSSSSAMVIQVASLLMLGPARRSRQRTPAPASACARWSGRSCWRCWRSSSQFVPLFDVLGLRLLLRARAGGGPGGRRRRARPGRGPGPARPTRRRLLRLCGAACGVAAALLVLPLLISRRQRASRPQLQLRAPGSASSRCCRSRPCCTRRPPGVLAGDGGPAARRGRVLAFAHPGAVAGLGAAAPLPRAARVRLRPVRRLLPRADLRRGAAPAAHPGLSSGW